MNDPHFFFEGVRCARVTLTDAEIKSLPSSAVEVIPAAGVGKILVVLLTFVELDARQGAYTNLSGATCKLSLNYANGTDNGVSQPVDENSTLFFSVAQIARAQLLPHGSNNAWATVATVGPDIDLENAAVEIGLDNAGAGDLTGGHESNRMVVTVLYVELPA